MDHQREAASLTIQNKFWRQSKDKPKLSELIKGSKLWDLQRYCKFDDYSVIDSKQSFDKLSKRLIGEHGEEYGMVRDLLVKTSKLASGKVISLSSEIGKTLNEGGVRGGRELAFSFQEISGLISDLDIDQCRSMVVERVCDPTTNLVDALAQDILRPGESDQLVSDIFVSLFLLTKMAPCIHVQSRLENDVGWLVLRAKASAIWNVLANIEKNNNGRGYVHVGGGNSGGVGNGQVGGIGNGGGGNGVGNGGGGGGNGGEKRKRKGASLRLGLVWLWISIDSYLDELQFWRRQHDDVESYLNIFKISCTYASIACQYTTGGVDVKNQDSVLSMIKTVKEGQKNYRFPTFSAMDEKYGFFYSCYDLCDYDESTGLLKNRAGEIESEKTNWKEFIGMIKEHADELRKSRDACMMSVDRLYINHQILIETSVIRNLFQLDGVILREVVNNDDGSSVAISNRFMDFNLLLSLSSSTSSCVDVIINYEDIPSTLMDLALNQLFVYENGKSDNCNGILAILKYVKGSLTTIHFAMENQLSGGVCSGSPRSLADTEWRVVSSSTYAML